MEQPLLRKIEFGKGDVVNTLARMKPEEIDQLEFGAMELDETGRVLSYNQAESRLAGRKREDVVGKLFFTEVAPCTNRAQFRGEFDKIVARLKDDALFEYLFDYKMKPTRVRVFIKRAVGGESYWVLITRQ